MLTLFKNTKWKTSEAHLLFLTKFLKGVDTSAATSALSYWQDVLQEPTQAAITRWIKQGAIVKASESITLERVYGVKELKTLCAEHTLPVSGTKPVLIKRLLEANLPDIREIIEKSQVYTCSAESKKIASDYLASAEQNRENAEQQAFQSLQKGDLKAAALTMVNYERKQVFPRGLNVNWDTRDIMNDVEELVIIMRDTPGILKNVDKGVVEALRIPTAMSRLFATKSALKWLPSDLVTGIHLRSDEACRMLQFYASHIVKTAGQNNAGLKHFELLCGAKEPCEACQRVNGKTFTFQSMPEVPLVNCKCEQGCRVFANPKLVS